MWHSVESLPTFTSVECSFAKQNTYYKYILVKWVNRPLNLILSESSLFFCANRPVRFFARIVPVESSQGGTGFCAKRPVTNLPYEFKLRFQSITRRFQNCIVQ